MTTDSRAVSPVVSVILMVAITIILAAAVSAFVLSLGDSTSEGPPSIGFSVDQQGDQIIVTHEAGETINTSNLRLTGVKGWGPSGQEFGAGEQITTTPTPDTEEVNIVWETTDSSSILRTIDASDIEVSSLIVNDGFERGTGDEADSWTESGSFTKIERTNELSLSGEYSLKQVDITGGYSGRTIISEPVDVSSSQEYKFGGSYYVRNGSSNTKYKSDVAIIWLNATGAETEGGKFRILSELEEWTKVSVNEVAPSDAVAARLQIEVKEFSNDDADIYWDQTFFEPVN